MSTKAEATARTISDLLSDTALPIEDRVKNGTLRMFGGWFGRPMDNIHWVVGAEADGDVLAVTFNEDEVLKIWRPEGVTIDRATFVVRRAKRVRWDWHYYGRDKVPENLRSIEHWVDEDGRVRVTGPSDLPQHFTPSSDSPAVELR